MQPIWIFSKNEELVAVLGDACPYYDATLTETIDSVDRLEFSIPGDHSSAANVVPGCIAVIETLEGTFRAFRIETQRQGFGEDGTRYCQYYCEDIAIDELNAAPVIDRRPNNPLDALIGALENSLWSVGQVDSGFPSASTNFYHESAMSALKKMVETWGGEFRFRIEHDGRRITGRYVDFLQQRGADNGVRVTVGKNMRSLEGETDITGLATALYGYGRGEEHDETGGFGRRISFADVEWKVENGDPVDKPLGQEWVGDPQALAAWGLQGGTVHRFGFVVFEDVEDPAELLRLTWEELQRRKAPQVNYKVGMVDLEATEGRSHEAVRIGDWVTAIDDDFKPPLEFKARVIEKKTPLREPEKAEITLGQVQPTLTDVIDKVERAADQAIKVGDPINLLDSVFETLTDELHTTAGYVYITPADGLLVIDKLKDQHPTSAIQLKGGMLAIADEWDAAKGDFNWRVFGTGSGFTADLIRAGTLDANLVEVVSVDLATGTNRKVELYDGNIYTYYQEKLTMALTGYSLDFFDHGDLSDGSNTGKLTGKVELAWTNKTGDPSGEYNARGIAVVTMHDLLGLAKTTPDDEHSIHEFAFYWNKGENRAYLTGPGSGGDYSKFWQLVLTPDHDMWEENFRYGPSMLLAIGADVFGNHYSGVYFSIGDKEHGGAGRYFEVWEHRDTSGTRYPALQMNAERLYLHRDYLQFRKPGTTSTSRGWIYTTDNTIVLAKETGFAIALDRSNKTIHFIIDGQTRFLIDSNGGRSV